MAKQFTKRDRRFLGIGVQGAIRGFFGGNAFLSIAILALICLFLIKEAYQFFPQHHAGLQLYRQSGLEYVDHIKRQVDGHTKLEGLVDFVYGCAQSLSKQATGNASKLNDKFSTTAK